MTKLSIRHNAGVEIPSGGGSVGISTAVRKFWRKHYASVPGMQMPNDKLNYLIAIDYSRAQPVFRFILKSGEPAEIRKSSNNFYYIAAIRKSGRHDIIVIQTAMKESPEEIKKRRLTKEWLEDVFQGKIKKKPKQMSLKI